MKVVYKMLGFPQKTVWEEIEEEFPTVKDEVFNICSMQCDEVCYSLAPYRREYKECATECMGICIEQAEKKKK